MQGSTLRGPRLQKRVECAIKDKQSWAFQQIADRLEGKPVQVVDATVDEIAIYDEHGARVNRAECADEVCGRIARVHGGRDGAVRHDAEVGLVAEHGRDRLRPRHQPLLWQRRPAL